MAQLLQFIDRLVSYETFIKDVASTVVKFIKTDKDDPEFVSQNKAYKMFGRRNVERWRKLGLVEPAKRPGRVEYSTAELRHLQRVRQDYFQRPKDNGK